MNFAKILFSLMGLTLISKVLGFLREIFLSYFYGASSTTDAYLVALTIPGVLFAFFSTAVAIGFVPTFTRVSNNVEERNNFVNNVFSILLVASTVIVILTIVFAEQLVYILAPGFDSETKYLAIKFTQIFVFGIYFSCWLSVFVAFLNFFRKFTVVALAGIPLNLSILLSIVLSYYYSIYWLVLGAVLGKLLEIILLYPVVRKFDYKFKFILNFRDENVKHLVLLSLPLTLSIAVNQINVIVDKSIASTLEVGAISAINYSHYLVELVVGIFVMSVATIFFPDLARYFHDNDYEKITSTAEKSLKLVNFFVVPSYIYFMVKSFEIITFVYQRGSFDQKSTDLTSSVFIFFAAGLLGFSYREVLTRIFYAMHNTRIPVTNSIIGVVVNIVLAYILSSFLGVSGLALATSIAAFVTTILLFLKLKKMDIFLDYNDLFFDLFKSTVAAIIAAGVAFVFKDDGWFLVFNFLLFAFTYLLFLLLLKNDIMFVLYNNAMRRYKN